MGFFDRALNAFGGGGSGGSGRPCPDCGEDLWTDDPGVRYVCRSDSCGSGVFWDKDGDLLDPMAARERENPAPDCISCGQSLAGGSHSAPWEDGDNAYAYTVCKWCGHKNIH